MTARRLLVAVALGAAAIASVCVAIGSARSQRPAQALLPDLDAVAPTGLTVRAATVDGQTRYRLGFVSAAENVGAGQLLIRGARASTEQAQMAAEQVIAVNGADPVVIPGVGVLEYVVDPTHEHWHLLGFMTYELRRQADFRLARPDTKTGFCLGDRYLANTGPRLPGQPADVVFNTNCGLDQPELLSLEEGISVGYGDVYEAWRDAQYVDVAGLPAGRYVLVHRVNPSRTLSESSYANNSASALVELAWPKGKGAKPRVRLLRACAVSARCPLR